MTVDWDVVLCFPPGQSILTVTFEVAGDLSEDALNIFIQVQTIPLTPVQHRTVLSGGGGKGSSSTLLGSPVGEEVQRQGRSTHDCHPVEGTAVGTDQGSAWVNE